jgi:hypothetical protein
LLETDPRGEPTDQRNILTRVELNPSTADTLFKAPASLIRDSAHTQ